MQYKKTLNKISITFVLLLMFFTFFSQTLADLRMPRVTLSFAEAGAIMPEAMSSGIVRPASVETIFAPVSGTIVQLVERGAQFWAEDSLFTIYSDLERLHEQISQAQHDQNILALNRERINNERALLQQQINQLMAETPTVPVLAEYDLRLAANANRLEIARRELHAQEALYEQGLVPRQAVLERENAVTAIELERQEILTRQELAVEAQAEHIAAQYRTRNTQLEQLQGAIMQMDVQLRINAAENNSLQRRMAELLYQLDRGETFEVRGGNLVVMELMPAVVTGALINEGAPVMTTALLDNNFIIEAPFDARHYFLQVGSVVEVIIGDIQINTLVQRVFNEGRRNIALIEINSRELSGGELALVRLVGVTRNFASVIPRSAIREDSFGYYVFVVEAEERLFGISYFAQMKRIEEVHARDSRNGAVSCLHDLEGPVIVNSDVPIYPGTRVRLVDSGDFVDTR